MPPSSLSLSSRGEPAPPLPPLHHRRQIFTYLHCFLGLPPDSSSNVPGLGLCRTLTIQPTGCTSLCPISFGHLLFRPRVGNQHIICKSGKLRSADHDMAKQLTCLFPLCCRKLDRKHYLGLLCCVVGIVLVGGSSILGGSGGVKGDAQQAMLGMFLIIIAQVPPLAIMRLVCHSARMHALSAQIVGPPRQLHGITIPLWAATQPSFKHGWEATPASGVQSLSLHVHVSALLHANPKGWRGPFSQLQGLGGCPRYTFCQAGVVSLKHS